MFIGNNNTNNFDVEPNHFYNLRTTINTDINSAKNDERIRTYSASQYVEFHASKNVSVIGGKFDTKYNASSEKYDLDAAYEVRPIVIQTQGRMVEVGVYTDESCNPISHTELGSACLLLPITQMRIIILKNLWIHISRPAPYFLLN